MLLSHQTERNVIVILAEAAENFPERHKHVNEIDKRQLIHPSKAPHNAE